MSEMVDSRKQERFKVEGDAYVYSASSFTFIGKVIDISPSGISFSYMADDDSEPIMIDELGILLSKKNSMAENLPLRVVSDEAVSGSPASAVVKKRCGGRFLSLTPEQEGELALFIKRHAVKEK